MAKDRVNLICDVAELAALFEGTASLEDFLGKVVSVVAYHMRAAVCSVYLYDERNDELVLRATQGLSQDAVGNVRLRRGEGIVGQALEESQPIREGHAATSRYYKHVPGIWEENYQAFLAVPILRGLTRVGVLVVQDPQPDYFDVHDVAALRAIAAQLATAIENARLLLMLHQAQPPGETTAIATDAQLLLNGIPISAGQVGGIAAVFSSGDVRLHPSAQLTDAGLGMADFEEALAATSQQLESLQRRLEEEHADIALLIFSTHLLMLKDVGFTGEMRRLIDSGTTVPEAIVQVVNYYASLFASNADPRFREKALDVKDVGHRLLGNLPDSAARQPDYAGQIVIAADPLPSDIVRFVAQGAGGLVLLGGSSTSHVSILARSMHIPSVLIADERMRSVGDGTPLLLDGVQGSVYLNPPELGVPESTAEEEIPAVEVPGAEGTTCTRDGVRVRVLANINMLSDLRTARAVNAEGVGLYRTEFPFVVRSAIPSEEEQYRIYRTVLEGMPGQEVTFRTLDLGGDKVLSYYPSACEANPFLGLRAIRFSLRHQDIFMQQIRALLRCGVGRRLRIMFPLIASVEEFLEAGTLVERCCDDLNRAGVPHNCEPELGVMVELPSAVEVLDELADVASFLSIGTNDLIQYLLAVDRTNTQMTDFYLPHHPAVLRTLHRITEVAQRHHVEVSLCGELGANPKLLPFLLGIGLRKISVEPESINALRAQIAAIDLTDAEQLARELLRMGRAADIAARLGVGAPD